MILSQSNHPQRSCGSNSVSSWLRVKHWKAFPPLTHTPLNFLQDSRTGSHDYCNLPPPSCWSQTSCETLVMPIWKLYNKKISSLLGWLHKKKKDRHLKNATLKVCTLCRDVLVQLHTAPVCRDQNHILLSDRKQCLYLHICTQNSSVGWQTAFLLLQK